MIEMIRDPLTHIVRNAIDHGIERPEERVKAGKPAAGTLKVSARQAGNQILIEVTDDGRGIDGEALVRKAKAAGLVTGEQAEKMTGAQRNALVFMPGLSTAGEVTAISGRGVGMDVVRANIERIGGVVDLDSRASQGVKLCIRVPLTLTIIPALTVSAGGQVFAIPRSAIDEILRVGGDAVSFDQVGEAKIATVRGRRMPMLTLCELLGLTPVASQGERRVILMRPAGGDAFALNVAAVHDHEELVVKPAAPAVMAAGLYAGTTLADDGSPILLLDPSGVAKVAGLGSEESDRAALLTPAPTTEAARETSLLLFRTLGGARRAVPVALVERIEDVPAASIQRSAGRLRVVLGEAILPLAGVEAAPGEGKLRILRLTDGAAAIAYGFAEVIDIRAVALDVQPASTPGEVSGVALIDGEQVEMLDPYWLFAAHGEAATDRAAQPVCALPEGDPWMENMLRPMLEGLGYRIVPAREGVEADVVIQSAECPPAETRAGQVLRIRSHPDGEDDDSIYRYDRAGLLNALAQRAKGAANG